jgi:RNA polymerase sigma-70 factor (ECF subfamily)
MKPGAAAAPLRDLTASSLERLRRGDAQAGEALDRLYRSALVRFCRRYLRSLAEAEDAAAEVLYKVISVRCAPRSFRAWLYRVARNHCLNLLRARRRRPGSLPLESSLAPRAGSPGPSTLLAREEERARAASLLSGLSQEFREALWLRYGEGLSRAEIAGRLAISPDLVRYRLYQGVKKLKEAAGASGRSGSEP